MDKESYDAYRTTSKLKWVIKMDDDVIINPSNCLTLEVQKNMIKVFPAFLKSVFVNTHGLNMEIRN